jgi:hypothetical protein
LDDAGKKDLSDIPDLPRNLISNRHGISKVRSMQWKINKAESNLLQVEVKPVKFWFIEISVIVNRVYLYSLFLCFFLFLFFLGEEGREGKRRKEKGRKGKPPSLINVTMKNKKASMIISSLRLFEISFSR